MVTQSVLRVGAGAQLDVGRSALDRALDDNTLKVDLGDVQYLNALAE